MKNYNLFNYQQKNVEHIKNMLHFDGGALVLDEVGLGKTITAVSSILADGGTNANVGVITPKKHISSWKDVLANEGMSFGILDSKALKGTNRYDYIVIDEAHNYNNPKTASYKNLFWFIRKNPQCKVIALSATIYNNSVEEYISIYSLPLWRKSSIMTYLFPTFAKQAIACEKKLQNVLRLQDSTVGDVVSPQQQSLESAMDDVLAVVSHVTVRNTREKIAATKSTDLELAKRFPNVNEETIHLQNSVEFESFVKTVSDTLQAMPFAFYNLMNYVVKGDKSARKNTANGFAQTFFMKRLDSSLTAFIESCNNFIEKANKMLENEDTRLVSIVKGKKEVQYEVAKTFFVHLKNDVVEMNKILKLAAQVNDGVKNETVLSLLDKHNKSVIFTEYNASMEEIANLLDLNGIKYLKVNAATNNSILQKVAKDFDANIDSEDMTDDYKVVLCTDVMSEGVNLHRAVMLIHYDCHWNPQRLTQRNGRINRIFKNKKYNDDVYVYRIASQSIIDSIIRFERRIGMKSSMSDYVLDFDYDRFKTKPVSELKAKEIYTCEKQKELIQFTFPSGYAALVQGRWNFQECNMVLPDIVRENYLKEYYKIDLLGNTNYTLDVFEHNLYKRPFLYNISKANTYSDIVKRITLKGSIYENVLPDMLLEILLSIHSHSKVYSEFLDNLLKEVIGGLQSILGNVHYKKAEYSEQVSKQLYECILPILKKYHFVPKDNGIVEWSYFRNGYILEQDVVASKIQMH